MKKVTKLLLFWFNRVSGELPFQSDEKAKISCAQVSHDWNALADALIQGNTARLIGFVPMIRCPEFDDLAEAIIALDTDPDPDPKGQELHFFGGHPVQKIHQRMELLKNPIDPNHLFATPESLDNLLSYALRFNGSERQIALTMMSMSLNLAHRLFEIALGNEVKPDHHHINKPLNHSSDN